jgi:hypothetical protein
MKTSTHLFVLAGLLVLVPLRGAGPAPEKSPSTLPADKEMAALEHFLDLTNEDLDQMQQAIARIRALDPAGRAALRREIEKFRSLPDAQRRQLRLGWGAQETNLKDAWWRMMQAASPERRAEIQGHLQVLAPDEKIAYRRQLAEEYLKTNQVQP